MGKKSKCTISSDTEPDQEVAQQIKSELIIFDSIIFFSIFSILLTVITYFVFQLKEKNQNQEQGKGN